MDMGDCFLKISGTADRRCGYLYISIIIVIHHASLKVPNRGTVGSRAVCIEAAKTASAIRFSVQPDVRGRGGWKGPGRGRAGRYGSD